jgi:hypothetical protein
MTQKSMPEVVAEVSRHTKGNRLEVEGSRFAGCVSCCRVFASKDVQSWEDEWDAPERNNRVGRWTALCPQCGKPTVIGSSTGLLDDQGYLPIVRTLLAKHAKERR